MSPAYKYRCKNCGAKLEFIESIKSNPRRKCPRCKKLKLPRLISQVNVIFKGENSYRSVDYINQKAKKDGAIHG